MLTRTNFHYYTMMADHKVLHLGSLLLCLFLLQRIRRVKQAWQAFENLPSYIVLVSPVSLTSRVLPRIPWISDGRDVIWKGVYERQLLPSVRFSSPPHAPCLGVFAASASDIIQLRSLLRYGTPQLLLADTTATKVE